MPDARPRPTILTAAALLLPLSLLKRRAGYEAALLIWDARRLVYLEKLVAPSVADGALVRGIVVDRIATDRADVDIAPGQVLAALERPERLGIELVVDTLDREREPE